MRSLSALVRAVILFVQCGFRVLPLAHDSKVPLKGTRGFLDAFQPDEVAATKIWDVDPTPNLGWALPDGVVALDFDDLETFARLESEGKVLPRTVWQRTRRGRHYYFLDQHRLLTQVTNLIAGLDIRIGGGSYVVVPPSIVGGYTYEWGEAPWDCPFALLPQWVYDLQTSHRRPAKPQDEASTELSSDLDHVLEGLSAGERNDGTFRYAARLRRLGLDKREARVLLGHIVAKAQQLPGAPFDLQEAEQVLEGVWRRYPPGVTADTNEARALRAISGSTFIEMELPPRMELLGDLILEKHLVLVHAKRGVGKTWCALDIARAIATGQSFLRWKAPQPRRVVYVDGEMPAVDLQYRLRALARSPSSELLSNLVLIASDLQDGAIPSLNSRDAQLMVEEHLEDVALVVIDSHSTLIGGDENDAAAFQSVMDWLLRLRRQGLAVLLVHHSGKGGEQRGSSRREDPMDVSIDLRHPTDYEPTEFGRFELHFRKTRGLIDASPLLVEIKQDHSGHLLLDGSPLADLQRLKARALKEQGLNNADIARELGVNRSTVGRWFGGAN